MTTIIDHNSPNMANNIQLVRHVLWMNNREERAHGTAVNPEQFFIDKYTHHMFPLLVPAEIDRLGSDVWGKFLSCYFEENGTFVVRYSPVNWDKE